MAPRSSISATRKTSGCHDATPLKWNRYTATEGIFRIKNSLYSSRREFGRKHFPLSGEYIGRGDRTRTCGLLLPKQAR